MLIGFAMIVCAIFAAIFLSVSGDRCLPPSALNVSPPANALTGTFRGSAAELAILKALVAAAKGSPAYETTITFAPDLPAADDASRYCQAKVLDLLTEIGVTVLAALAVGFRTTRRGRG